MVSPYGLKNNQDIAAMGKCPLCGALNVFVRYEHVKQKTLLPPHVGRCIRPNCHYFYSAKKFFEDKDGVFTKRSFYVEGMPF